MTTMNITIVAEASGQSESIPVTADTSVKDLTEWAAALLGMDNDNTSVVLLKDGRPIAVIDPTTTLQAVGITDGDLLVVVSGHSIQRRSQQQQQQADPPAAAAGGGGLDFSALLANAGATTSSSNNNNNAAATTTATVVPKPVYYDGMSLHEAQSYNPHPQAFCTVLYEHEHLRKELNYYQPRLVADMFPNNNNNGAAFLNDNHDNKMSVVDRATKIWRETMIKGGIQSALSATSKFHEEKQMQDRLAQNPNDVEARAYFDKKDRQKRIAEQREQVYEEYPESFASVIMLYIQAKINGHDIQAFCDSGAQSTIISYELAKACGLADWIDERHAGLAVGVGSRKILGRLHAVQLQIGDRHYFPCTVTVLEDPAPDDPAQKMGFLLGLDMMKRHLCVLDLKAGCLKFRLADDGDNNNNYLETPFLHEKDLDREKGGTKGFDAAKSNAENEKRMEED